MVRDDASPDADRPRPGNVTATASADDGRATAHVRVEIVLHGTDQTVRPRRATGGLPVAVDAPPPANPRPRFAPAPSKVAAAGIAAAVLAAAAFAAGALIF